MLAKCSPLSQRIATKGLPLLTLPVEGALNQFTSGILYIFSGPPCGITFSENSEKKFLAINKKYFSMRRSQDNQINAFLIDISRIKWLVFCYGHLSSAQLDRWQAPKQRPGIDQCPVERMAYLTEINDNEYKSVFTNSWLVRQRNRPWIKGLGKNPQTSELIHSWQCLLSGATEP